MSEKTQILDALAKLDPAKDNDWTEDGMPSLDRVKEIMMDDEVTREMVTDASSGLTRAVATELKAEADKPSDEAAVEPSEGEKDGGGDAIVHLSEVAQSDEDRRREMEEIICQIEDEISAHDEVTRDRAREREQLVAEKDKAKKAMDAAFPPMNQAEMTQQWLRRQHERREQASQAVMVHRNPASALDASMRRSTGFGGGRKKVPNLFSS